MGQGRYGNGPTIRWQEFAAGIAPRSSANREACPVGARDSAWGGEAVSARLPTQCVMKRERRSGACVQ